MHTIKKYQARDSGVKIAVKWFRKYLYHIISNNYEVNVY